MKKSFFHHFLMIFGILAALLTVSLPTLMPVCQARAASLMARHPCCKGMSSCGPQFTKSRCCQAHQSLPDPRAVMVSENIQKIQKIFPTLEIAPAAPTISHFYTSILHPFNSDFKPSARFLLFQNLLC